MIAIDATAGLQAPGALVRGAAKANVDTMLVGRRVSIEPELRRLSARQRRAITVVDADDAAAVSARLVVEGRAQASLSAMAAPQRVDIVQPIAGCLTGVDAPAVASVFPTTTTPVTLLDLGASTASDAKRLIALARLGAGYTAAIGTNTRPRVALLAPHADSRTPARIHEASVALAQTSLNAHAPIDGVGLFQGQVDVAVTDGLTGQILMETVEGLGIGVAELLRDQIRGNLLAGAGALLMSRLGRSLEQRLDDPGLGVGLIVGLAQPHFVTHPNAGEKMWASAIRAADNLRRRPVGAAVESAMTA